MGRDRKHRYIGRVGNRHQILISSLLNSVESKMFTICEQHPDMRY